MPRALLLSFVWGPVVAALSVVLGLFINVLFIALSIFLASSYVLFIPIVGPLVLALIGLVLSVLYWVQTARWAAGITGAEPLVQQPRLGEIFPSMILIAIACFVLGCVAVFGLTYAAWALGGVQQAGLEAVFRVAWNPSGALTSAWSALGAPIAENAFAYISMLVGALLLTLWVMILVARATGINAARGSYSTGLIMLRVAYTLALSFVIVTSWQQAVGPAVAAWLFDLARETALAAIVTGAGLIAFWVSLLMGFVFAFECLLLARTVAAPATRVEDTSADIRALRKTWESRD